MLDDAFPEPLDATVCDAAVVVSCVQRPFAVALTPKAARESARRLLLAARAARAAEQDTGQDTRDQPDA